MKAGPLRHREDYLFFADTRWSVGPPHALAARHQAEAVGESGRFATRADAELAQKGRDMMIDGLFGDEQGAGDIGIAAPLNQMREHAEFARRQSMGILLVGFLCATGDAANPRGAQLV